MKAKKSQLSVGFLFDDTLDSSDGVAQYIKTIGAWLTDQGHDVSYLVGQTRMRTWHSGKVYSLARNVRVIFNGNRLSIPLPAPKKPLKRILAEKQFDVLHVQVPYSPFMAQRVINLAGPNTAVVGTFHIFPSGSLANWGTRLLYLVCRRSLRRFSQMVSVSLAAGSFAKQTFKLQTEIIPNTISSSYFNSHVPLIKSTKQIVFLGRLVPRKGCRELIEAFALLHQKLPEVRLTIAGDGPQRRTLEILVKRRGLAGCVDFLGFIDEPDKPRLLASADIACFPSLSGEAFGIVLIEALAAGAGIVLGGDNPGYRSVLGAQPKLLIDPKDSSAFAQRLAELLTNKPLIQKLHTWQKTEAKRYDIAEVGQEILAMYRKVIAKQRSNSHNNYHAARA